ASHARTVGMPLAPAITTFDRERLRDEARDMFSLPAGAATILVLGGSQGAATLNRAAVGLALHWRGRGDRHIVLETGEAQLAGVTPERLVPLLDDLLDDPGALAAMGAAARGAARPHAADELAAWVLELARHRRAPMVAGTTP